MKALADILRDADPMASEPHRVVQTRFTRRQAILDASRVGRSAERRPIPLASAVAFVVLGVALCAVYWTRTTVDAVAAVRFEVRLAEDNPAPGLREATPDGTARRVYLHAEAIVANVDIAGAKVIPGDRASTFGVSVSFNAEGAAKMRRATQGHTGRPVAILVDGHVILAPIVRSPIDTSAIISGNFERAEADRIVGGILGR